MDLQKLTMPDFPLFHFSVAIGKPFLVLIFAVFLFVYAIISSILFYHWSSYGMNSVGIVVAEVLFLLISVILFAFAGFGILYF